MINYIDKNQLSFGDAADFQTAVDQYYNGLGTVAMVSTLGYIQLVSEVINNKDVNNKNTIMLSEFTMQKANKSLANTMSSAVKTTLATVFAAGMPVSVGNGPRGILITSETQQALVNAGYQQSFVGEYFLFSKSSVSSGVYIKDIWALAYSGEEKVRAAGGLINVLRSVEVEAQAAGVKSLVIRGKQVVNEGLLGLSAETAAKYGYQLQKVDKDIITLTKNF